MSEKIDLRGVFNFESLLGWAIIRAITQKAGSDLSQFNLTPGMGSIEVCLTINGVEVSLKDTLNVWKEERDRLVRKDAMELVEERFGKLFGLFDDFEREAKCKVEELFSNISAEGGGEREALKRDLPL